jgi:hypothetical protein
MSDSDDFFTCQRHKIIYRDGDDCPRCKRLNDLAWEEEQRKLFLSPPDYYATPSDWSQCRNYISRRPSAAIPCWYPHCTCMGEEAKAPRGSGRAIAGWVVGWLLLGVAAWFLLSHYG